MEGKGLFTSNSLQCELKQIRIECASNPDSIRFGIFHFTEMQCALSNRIIMQSALCVLYIESNSVSTYIAMPLATLIILLFWLGVIRLHYKHEQRENEENM